MDGDARAMGAGRISTLITPVCPMPFACAWFLMPRSLLGLSEPTQNPTRKIASARSSQGRRRALTFVPTRDQAAHEAAWAGPDSRSLLGHFMQKGLPLISR